MLRILVLKEKKDNRVCLIPSDIKKLIENKIVVYVEKNAGLTAGYTDQEYISAGATIINKVTKEVIDKIDIIATVTVNRNKKLFTIANPNIFFWGYQYLVNNTKEMYFMLKNNISSIGVEAISKDSIYEFIIPNEKIKGSYAPILAADYLSKAKNKFAVGQSIAKIDENGKNANFTILNYSYSGYFAAIQALAMGANVTYIDQDDEILADLTKDKKIVALTKAFNSTFKTVHFSHENLVEEMKNTNVLIATNQLPTVKTVAKITNGMLESMPKGSVFVDLAVETGFSSDVETKPANIKKQFQTISGVACVTVEHISNLFPKVISDAISGLNTKYFIQLAKSSEKSLIDSISKDKTLSHAVMTYRGNLTNSDIASSLSLKYTSLATAKK